MAIGAVMCTVEKKEAKVLKFRKAFFEKGDGSL
jgi:hypothetical protein